jgi:hypothetical protein
MRELLKGVVVVVGTIAIALLTWFSMSPIAYYSRIWSEYWK